jgi:uncharacterized protein YndB with AHSA1/START domain
MALAKLDRVTKRQERKGNKEGDEMEGQSVSHSTFVIEQTIAAAPERVFTAFADPVQKKIWFTEGFNKESDTYETDFRVGGSEIFRYHYREGAPFAGIPFVNDASYQDIVQDRRIVNASTMSIGGKCISASLTSFEFLPTEAGTKLVFTFQGAFFEGADGPQYREMGWRKLLGRLNEQVAQQ